MTVKYPKEEVDEEEDTVGDLTFTALLKNNKRDSLVDFSLPRKLLPGLTKRRTKSRPAHKNIFFKETIN